MLNVSIRGFSKAVGLARDLLVFSFGILQEKSASVRSVVHIVEAPLDCCYVLMSQMRRVSIKFLFGTNQLRSTYRNNVKIQYLVICFRKTSYSFKPKFRYTVEESQTSKPQALL